MIKNYTKYLYLLFAFFAWQGQAQMFDSLDSIPQDIVYFRANKITPPSIKVIYGRPQKKNRELFGTLIPYNKVWKVGASGAAEIKFYNDVVFGGKKVKAGTYVLYAIPGEKEWTIILNSNIDKLATAAYDKKKDVVRVKAKVRRAEFVEAFSIAFKEKEKYTDMVFAWDVTRVAVSIRL